MDPPSFAGLNESVPKQFRVGTHRALPPSATLERISRLMPVLGITRIANVTGLDVIGVPVAMAVRPNARSLSVSQGKGIDLDAAKASGLMEATELYHAERVLRPLKLGSHAELRFTHDVIDVARLPQISTSGLHEHLRMLWVEGYDLLQRRPIWLPYETVHVNCTLEPIPGSGCFPLTSNGLASGNHVLEAITHGICEVIERDADAVWRLRARAVRAATRIDLDTVDDPICAGLFAQCAGAEAEAAVWETTSDIGVAAFRCTLVDRRPQRTETEAVSFGMGCHPSSAVALARAITEACQSRLTMIAGSRDDMFRDHYQLARNPDVAAEASRAHVTDGPMRRFRDVHSADHDTFGEEVAWLLERLAAVGITSIVAVDLGHAALGVPVVRIVIPGLEGSADTPWYLPGERALADRGPWADTAA